MTSDDVAAWADLQPDSDMVTALAYAEGEVSRLAIRDELARVLALPTEEQRKRERAVLRDMRKRWSERFATACATMLADEVRAHSVIGRRYSVLPDKDGAGQENFTPLGYTKGKRIDVVVTGPLVGLQIGISLKGLNFADDARGSHDKNLTGRLYELRDEVSTVHDYLPRALMAAFFFMPVSGCVDKTDAPSSFAHLVAELRARTGRLDPSVAAHAWRCDFAAVGLYTAGDPWETEAGLATASARYFPVSKPDGSENPRERSGLTPRSRRSVPSVVGSPRSHDDGCAGRRQAGRVEQFTESRSRTWQWTHSWRTSACTRASRTPRSTTRRSTTSTPKTA